MASKLKQTQLRRKEQYERKLNNRLALLAERKMEPARTNKDPLVKSLRAQIEATDARLKAIAALEKRAAELAKAKAEKAEAEKAAKTAKAAPAKPEEGGKEKKEKKEKGAKAPAEGQEKKEKKEKKKKEEKPA
jgi:colicin import membrane protein